MPTRAEIEIRELGPEEWDQRVDEQARKRLGMSGEEFEWRLNAGEIDIDDSPDVTRVAMMLPLHATRK
jgi:methyl coenzyme M reductase subunit D